MHIKHILSLGLAALAAGAATGAHAQTWTKTGNPGNTPATAQATIGTGPLTLIKGTLTSTQSGTERTVAEPSNPDLFQIFISGPFSATTATPFTNLFNPELALFDITGRGVVYNNDTTATSQQATIPVTVLSPGLYYIGVGVFGAIPRSGAASATANDIFPDPIDGAAASFTAVSGPTGGGGGSPLTKWQITSTDVETGTYGISLTGATFTPAPEPSPVAALAVGALSLVGLALSARRRRRLS